MQPAPTPGVPESPWLHTHCEARVAPAVGVLLSGGQEEHVDALAAAKLPWLQVAHAEDTVCPEPEE